MDFSKEIFLLLYLLLNNLDQISNHGRLVDPPSRSSAWRYGFNTEPNYNDNQLFCGGFTTQWKVNKGKCGICGDPFNGRKDNELPNGKYARNLVITKTYEQGNIIEAKVELTANHNGFFLFKLCPTTNDKKEVTQKCLNRFLLKVLNSNETDKYVVPSKRAEMFTIVLKLPNGLNCKRCLFQWTYIAANNWGKCDNGLSAVGCGPQETFRGCADIKIIGKSVDITKDERIFSISSTQLSTKLSETNENLKTTKFYTFDDINYSMPELTTTQTIEKKCHSIGIWKRLPNMDEWCLINCKANYCPQTHCKCF